jgi:type I restriction enzyme S subunit
MIFEAKRLGDIAEIIGGGTPSTKDAGNWDGDIPWLTPKDLSSFEGIYVDRGTRSITEQGFKSSSAKMLPAGTVLYTSRAPIGYVAIASNAISTNQGFKSLILKDGYVPEFVFYLLKASKSEIESYASGGTFAEISAKALSEVVLQFPPKVQQEAIAKLLKSLDEKIVTNNAISKTLEDIAQTIFKSWFIDFDPVTAKMAGEKPAGMDTTTSALFPDSMEESELGLMPKGWNINAISEFGKVVTGKTPSTKVPEYWGDEVPFVTIPDMHGQILVTSTARALSKQGADSQRSQNVPAGSTMVTCIATPGLVGYATKNCQTNQQINSVIPSMEHPSEWLFWHLRGLIPTLIRNSGIGTVFANLNKSDFSKIKSITPSMELRNAFNDIVEPIVELLETLNHESQYLRDIRDGLLPRLISGEFQIPEEMLAS